MGKFTRNNVVICSLIAALIPATSVFSQQPEFPAFTRQQVLDHFQYYHERSEANYQGDGTWVNLEYKIAHPLMRDSSRRATGYMRAFQTEGNPVYENRARAALDYLVTQQRSDGHWTWWHDDAGTDNTLDCQYVTGTAAAALGDGYVMFGEERYLRASARAAEWAEYIGIDWNTNYVMFAAWHLAKHYGITGEQRWLDAAVYKVKHCALPRQHIDGSWNEGPTTPGWILGHNKRMWYHGIILRSLIELYRVLPMNHPIREPLRNSIELGVNRAIRMQKPSGEIAVGADIPNEHRNAFILEALLMAHEHVGIDTRNAIRGIMQYRMDPNLPPHKIAGFNIDIEAIGYLLQRFDAITKE